jgi:Carboxypeptidase regulatory-like domain/TonB-dependent Receptor Plug Domain
MNQSLMTFTWYKNGISRENGMSASESVLYRGIKVIQRRTVFVVILMLAIAGHVFAQSPTGTISGIVLDPTGKAIVEADVKVINDATGVQYPTKSNGDGIYVVPNLPPGMYRLQVEKLGFKTLIKPDIVLNVQDALAINFTLPIGAASETITVEGGAPLLNTQSASVSTVIDHKFIENLPMNGRSFNTLLQLTPGVVIAPVNGQAPGQFSISGQRSDGNNFTVDGVSANFGVGSSLSFGGSGTGTGQAFSALGGTSSLVSVEDLQEFRVETSSFAPQFGRSPGGQVILTTRSGANDFHGGVYDYLRNTVMDANNWFASNASVPRAPEHHNDFGAYAGGPIKKGKTFFFVSYEGARLGQPQTSVLQVPSLFARSQASATLAPYLNAYPLPTGQAISPTAFTAPLTASFSNAASLDAGSVRIDHTFNSRFSIFGRYNKAPSSLLLQNVNNPETTINDTQTLTVGADMQFSSHVLNALRANYSSQTAGLSFSLDNAGGAVPLSSNLLSGGLATATSFMDFGNSDTYTFDLGKNANNRTRQFNIVDDLSWISGTHDLRFGMDFREIYLDKEPFKNELLYSAGTVQTFESTGQASLSEATAANVFLATKAFSLYGQDTWKISQRLTMTYGLRWELSPPPTPRGSTTFAAWTNVNTPAQIGIAPAGTPLWNTTLGNFAPRFGIVYALTKGGSLVVRAGAGIFYDIGVGQVSELGTSFPNFEFGSANTVSLPVGNVAPLLPVLSTQPPFSGVQGYDPNLKLPRSYQWNVALEKSFWGKQALSVTYVGQAGRDLLRQAAIFQPNANFIGDFLLRENDARSNYDALQLQYRLPISSRFQALANYTWSHSLDNASSDAVEGPSNIVISTASDYGNSDFDVRHSFSGTALYEVPGFRHGKTLTAITDGWSLDTVVVARTGFPFNAEVIGAGVAGLTFTRPDLVPGQPFWISSPTAPGRRILNAAAFVVPSTIRQGTEPRNDIAGFGLTQVDLSVGRKFPITERINLQFRADAFNLFNHPNFTNPQGFFQFGSSFLRSSQMLNQGLGGLNPLFQEGGPRSLQMSLKLTF